MTQENRHFYLPIEFAQAFQLSLTVVYRMIREGELGYIRIRKQIRIPKAEYCKYCHGNGGCSACVFMAQSNGPSPRPCGDNGD